MGAIATASRAMTGTESARLLNELARWGDSSAGIAVQRSEDALEVAFADVDPQHARRMVEDVLTMANASWPIHVGLDVATA